MRAERQKRLGLRDKLWLLLMALVVLLIVFGVFFAGCGEGAPT